MNNTKKRIYCNNGTITKVIYDLNDLPEGWYLGKANLQYKKLNIEKVKTYYKDHSIRDTASFFNLTEKALTKYLQMNNIKLRSKEEYYKLSQQHIEQTNIKKYGCKSTLQLAETKEKSKQTCLELYGVEYASQSDAVKSKTKQTNLEKYGVEYYLQSEDKKEKSKQTCLEKYGVENPMQCGEIKQKVINTNINNYNTPWIVQSSEFKAKAKSTKKEKYNDENYNNRNKASQTCLARYGVEWFGLSKEYINQCHHGYKLNAELFDSIPELAFWIYCCDNNINIKRNTEFKFEYYYNDKKHYYIPDFIIEDKFIEIKGDLFFKEDGTMYNPWDITQDGLYEAKHQCMLQNNIEIITTADYMKYINYCTNKFGWNWHQQYKCSSEEDENE